MKYLLCIALFVVSCLASYQHGVLTASNGKDAKEYDTLMSNLSDNHQKIFAQDYIDIPVKGGR